MKNRIEQQQSKSESKISKVISNVDNNILKRENKQLNSYNRSKGQGNYTLKSTIETVQLKHSFKIKINNIKTKHATSYISKTNVDSIILM